VVTNVTPGTTATAFVAAIFGHRDACERLAVADGQACRSARGAGDDEEGYAVMATVIGSGGGVLWLVAVLFALSLGLAGALLAATRSAATRSAPTPMRAGTQRTGTPRRTP
jgi:hypothetical protein